MARALATGRKRGTRASKENRSNNRLAQIINMPMPVKTMASPTLKATTSNMPNSSRPREIALKRRTRAAGHGTRPPVTPRASKLRQVTFEPSDPGGRWVCACPP